MNRLILTTMLGAAVALTSSGARALPAALRVPTTTDEIIEVRGGCGLGWHRGPWGACRPNGAPYAYVMPPYAAPRYARCWWRATAWGPQRVCTW